MQDVLTVTLVLAGLFFSISCALLLEELVFGLFFRALSPSRRRSQPKNSTQAVQPAQAASEGELSCSH